MNELAFAPARGKFVRISLTQQMGGQSRGGGQGRRRPAGEATHWSIGELTLYTPGAPIRATAKDVNKYE